MNSELFKAILALDSYNRGYNAGISSVGTGLGTGSENIGTQIGNATIATDSEILGKIAGTGIRQDLNIIDLVWIYEGFSIFDSCYCYYNSVFYFWFVESCLYIRNMAIQINPRG
jgi:hypothetical protein